MCVNRCASFDVYTAHVQPSPDLRCFVCTSSEKNYFSPIFFNALFIYVFLLSFSPRLRFHPPTLPGSVPAPQLCQGPQRPQVPRASSGLRLDVDRLVMCASLQEHPVYSPCVFWEATDNNKEASYVHRSDRKEERIIIQPSRAIFCRMGSFAAQRETMTLDAFTDWFMTEFAPNWTDSLPSWTVRKVMVCVAYHWLF